MNNKTEENKKLILGLQLICDCESSKPLDEMNCDLIDACVSLLLDLQDKKVTLTQEQIKEKVSMIPFEEISEFKNNEETPKRRKVLKKNKVLFIAAVISILITLLAVVSVAFEWNIFEELKNRFGSVANTPVNEEIVVDGDSIVVYGDNINYKSIEESLISKQYDVLYPNVLPGSMYVETVTYYQKNNESRLVFNSNSEFCFIEITLNKKLSEDIKDISEEIIEINGKKCYLIYVPEMNHIQLYFEYSGDLYKVSHNNKQEIITIVENLKELE